MSKDSTQRPRPDLNRGPFDPKSDAVTDLPLRLQITPNAPLSPATKILTHRKFVKMQYLEAVCEKQKERQARLHPAVWQISASVSVPCPASVQLRKLSSAELKVSDLIVLEDTNTPVFYNYDIPDKETESNHATHIVRFVRQLESQLPVFDTRQMRRDFYAQFGRLSRMSPAVMRAISFDLTEYATASTGCNLDVRGSAHEFVHVSRAS